MDKNVPTEMAWLFQRIFAQKIKDGVGV